MSTSYEKLTIANPFMFGKIAQDVENCEIILRCLQNEDMQIASVPQREKYMQARTDGKFIRLDLYAEDRFRRIFDTEMQNESKDRNVQKELPYRARYYQSTIDAENVDLGDKYLDMKDVYVIFICTFDPFGEGEYKYTFKNGCVENNNVNYIDGGYKIFFNTKGDLTKAPEETRAFLEYVNEGIVRNDDIRKLDDSIKKAKANKEWRQEYMRMSLFEQDAIYKGKIIGEKIGKEIGKEIGEEKTYISQIILKAGKGKDIIRIADEIEKTPDEIVYIYNTVIANSDKNADEIWNIIHGNKNEK